MSSEKENKTRLLLFRRMLPQGLLLSSLKVSNPVSMFPLAINRTDLAVSFGRASDGLRPLLATCIRRTELTSKFPSPIRPGRRLLPHAHTHSRLIGTSKRLARPATDAADQHHTPPFTQDRAGRTKSWLSPD